jgi:hypothetical protein
VVPIHNSVSWNCILNMTTLISYEHQILK